MVYLLASLARHFWSRRKGSMDTEALVMIVFVVLVAAVLLGTVVGGVNGVIADAIINQMN